jgi:hypothetical protein
MSFASRYLSELESNKGLVGGAKSAAKGTMRDIGKKFSGEEFVRGAFGGDDILSAFIRGKLGVKKKTTKEKTPEKTDGQDLAEGSSSLLKIIAKNSMSLPGMARDMNVMRQNVQKLVKLKAGPQKKGGKAYATGADAFFLREDERERAIEAQRQGGDKKSLAPTQEEGKEGGGFLDSIMSMFSGGFMTAIRTIFNPKNLMKVFSKIFLPLAIIGTLFSGITAGFKKYQETGSFSEAIVSGLGGMLKFLTLGLFGEDTLKNLFDSISNFFSPITDTISNIFNGIKDFFKGLFGIQVEDEAPKEMAKVKPNMPDMSKFASGMAKSAGESDEKAADIGGLFGAVQAGDAKGLFGKAQEFAAKYPEPPPSETSPTPMSSEGVPLDQAQRNYELNKALTGEASKALGQPLEMPAPPTPATPPAPVQTSPTPAPEMSDADKIKQLEGYIEGNKKRFARRESDAARHIASFKKRYADDPARVKELEDDYKQTLDVERKEMEEANAGFQRQIDFIRNTKGGTVSADAAAAASAPAAAASSSGGSMSTQASAPSAPSAPGPISAEPPTTGSSLADASSQVAEAQRMESAADTGSVVNAPTTNNSSGQSGQTPKTMASAYNEDLIEALAS